MRPAQNFSKSWTPTTMPNCTLHWHLGTQTCASKRCSYGVHFFSIIEGLLHKHHVKPVQVPWGLVGWPRSKVKAHGSVSSQSSMPSETWNSSRPEESIESRTYTFGKIVRANILTNGDSYCQYIAIYLSYVNLSRLGTFDSTAAS